MKRSTFLLIACLSTICMAVHGQELPVSQVYAFQYQAVADGGIQLSKPRFLTAFNRTGYNNQPSFRQPGVFYLTVQQADRNQTDIYEFDLAAGTRTRLLATGESEYSAQVSADGDHFYTVRVDAETPGVQRLWQFSTRLKDKGTVLLPDAKRIGYYQWLDAERVAYFEVGNPNTLVVANLTYRTAQRLTPDIGRCLQLLPNGNLAYLHKITPTQWSIKELDKRTLTSKVLAPALSGSEDFLPLSDGSLLMGKGSKLWRYLDGEWKVAADLSKYGITRINRMARDGKGTLLLVNGG